MPGIELLGQLNTMTKTIPFRKHPQKRPLWPLRHLIKVIKIHDLTNQKKKGNTFRKQAKKVTSEISDLWDSEWKIWHFILIEWYKNIHTFVCSLNYILLWRCVLQCFWPLMWKEYLVKIIVACLICNYNQYVSKTYIIWFALSIRAYCDVVYCMSTPFRL